MWNVLHPAASGARGFYEYRLADSLEIRIQGRRSRVFELEVRPRDPRSPGAVGSVFVDRESGAIARMRFTFTKASYRDPELVSIVLDELERRDLQRGMLSLCVGGGMGISTIIERV